MLLFLTQVSYWLIITMQTNQPVQCIYIFPTVWMYWDIYKLFKNVNIYFSLYFKQLLKPPFRWRNRRALSNNFCNFLTPTITPTLCSDWPWLQNLSLTITPLYDSCLLTLGTTINTSESDVVGQYRKKHLFPGINLPLPYMLLKKKKSHHYLSNTGLVTGNGETVNHSLDLG